MGARAVHGRLQLARVDQDDYCGLEVDQDDAQGTRVDQDGAEEDYIGLRFRWRLLWSRVVQRGINGDHREARVDQHGQEEEYGRVSGLRWSSRRPQWSKMD